MDPQTSITLLKRLAPQLETTSTLSKVIVGIGMIILGIGGYALVVQILEGHIVTGMRDHVVWGIYIANFIFFIGISYAGALISGILHLLQVEWRRPIIRIAEMITVISTIIGPLYILLCMGRFDRLHHLILYGRIQSPIMWDVLAIATYLVGSLIFLYLACVRDFSLLRDFDELKVGKWRKKLYRVLALGYFDSSSQKRMLNNSLNMISAIIIPVAVIVHSVLAWIFGMTLRPGWHSSIFGPYFVVAAVLSGTGVLVLAMWFFRKVYKLEDIIKEKHFNYLGTIIMVLAAVYGYFTFSEYLTIWYGNLKWDYHLIAKLFDPNQYGLWFFSSAIACIALPILVNIPKFKSIGSITLVSLIMVIGMWVKRYLIIIPTLETPLIPMQDLRIEWVKYSATWVEWALTFAGIALFFLMFYVAARFVPIVPISDLSDGKENLKRRFRIRELYAFRAMLQKGHGDE